MTAKCLNIIFSTPIFYSYHPSSSLLFVHINLSHITKKRKPLPKLQIILIIQLLYLFYYLFFFTHLLLLSPQRFSFYSKQTKVIWSNSQFHIYFIIYINHKISFITLNINKFTYNELSPHLNSTSGVRGSNSPRAIRTAVAPVIIMNCCYHITYTVPSQLRLFNS